MGWAMTDFLRSTHAIPRLFLAPIAIVLCCACVHASKKPLKDPVVIIAGGGGSLPLGNLFQIISPSGTSPLNLLGGSACVVAGLSIPDCIFQNGTSSTWTSLTFSISPGNQKGPFSCLALLYFSKCSFKSDGSSVTFSGGTGIGPGHDFLFSVLLWAPETIFAGTAEDLSDSAALRSPPSDKAQESPRGPSSMPSLADSQAALVDWRELRPADEPASSPQDRTWPIP